MRAEEIIKLLEEQFPPSLAMDWDNSGLQVGSRKTEVKKVLVALDATQKVVDHCVEAGVDLLVTHHPLMLDGLRKVNEDTMYGRKIRWQVREWCITPCIRIMMWQKWQSWQSMHCI